MKKLLVLSTLLFTGMTSVANAAKLVTARLDSETVACFAISYTDDGWPVVVLAHSGPCVEPSEDEDIVSSYNRCTYYTTNPGQFVYAETQCLHSLPNGLRN